MKKLLCLTVILIVLFSINVAFATNEIMTLTATYNDVNLENNQFIGITADETDREITIAVSEIDILNDIKPDFSTLEYAYCWDNSSKPILLEKDDDNQSVLTIPDFEKGSQHVLQIEAIINDRENGYIGNSNVITLYIVIEENNISTSLSIIVLPSTTVVASHKTQLLIYTNTNSMSGIEAVAYRWDNDKVFMVNGDYVVITVPEKYEANTEHLLRVQSKSNDGTLSEVTKYKVVISD